jgi:hypothetical protein
MCGWRASRHRAPRIVIEDARTSRRGRILDEFRLSPRVAHLLDQGLRATRPLDVQ